MKWRMIFSAFIAVLSATTPAYAFPVLGFLGGILAAGGIVTPLIGFGSIGIVNAGFAFATFLSSGFGSLLLSVGIAAAQYFLGRQKRPSIESARITVRIPEPERWLHAGRTRAGGAVLFGEYDAAGVFWMIVVHGDSMLIGDPISVIFDEIPVTINPTTHYVTTKEFTRTLQTGGQPAFRFWTTTYTDADVVPPAITEFKTAFSEWTDDHKLAGTTFSVMAIDAMDAETRYKVLTWRGPMGLGEPAISIVGDWSKIYDPRNEAHDIDDPSTWGSTRNPELIWAWFRTHPYGRNKPMSSIAWDKVAIEASKCDVAVADKNGDEHPRYQCGIAVPDSKERHVGESEILLSMDAIVIYDEQGKSYAKVGVWEEPTLQLSAKRDVIAMAVRDAQDDETETDGVIVKYIDPAFNWIAQPCAPWKNPNFFVEGRVPKYLTVEILACQEHNQAVRLAKSIGMRSQPLRRLAPTVGLRGIKARRERILALDYDSVLTGNYEVATPVELDEAGMLSGMGLVPIDANRWTLLPGEEGNKPIPQGPLEFDDTLPYPTSVVVYGAAVPGSGGNSVRIEATFDAPTRADYRFEFQYKKHIDTIYRPMIVLMDDLLAYSDTVEDAEQYDVQYRTVSISGRANDWKTPPVSVSPIADTVAPLALSSFGVIGGNGNATLTFATAGGDTHLRKIGIFRVPTGGTLDTTTHLVTRIAAAPGTSFSYVDGDATTVNLLGNQDYTTATGLTLGANWTQGSGVVSHATGSETGMNQPFTFVSAVPYRFGIEITAQSVAGTGLFATFSGGATRVDSTPPFSGVGKHFGKITPNSGNTTQGYRASTWVGSLDNPVVFKETAACAPQGTWDYYAIPMNGSNVAGPTSGPVTVTIY